MEQQKESRVFIENALQRFKAFCHHNSMATVEDFLKEVEPAEHLTQTDRQKLIVKLLQHETNVARRDGRHVELLDLERRFPDCPAELFEDIVVLPELPEFPLSTSPLPDRYQLIERIGIGGIGEVWRVVDKRMKRPLAVKMLRPEHSSNPAAVHRLQQEAILTGSLQHPGVPPVYDHGILANGTPFFCMKLVDGKTLEEILESGRAESAFLISVFEQLAQTLAYAHARHVIHRDIKPQNVMVGEFGEVQLMDWGMAKSLDLPEGESQTATTGLTGYQLESAIETAVNSVDSSLRTFGLTTKDGDIIGTPAYMSPEQARGDRNSIDQRSDVFSLGALLFEILTGQRIYGEKSAQEVLAKAARGELHEIDSHLQNDKIDDELRQLCCHCLQVNAQDRPASAGFVAASIATHQANFQNRVKQAEIERRSALVQGLEQRKRLRWIVGLSTLVAVVSMVGAIAFAWQWNKASISAATAEQEVKTRTDINDFLVLDFLQQANPFEAADPDLKVRVVLDRAAERIEQRFADRPDIEAEIRMQIGDSYLGLSEFQAAKDQFIRASELMAQLFGEDDDRTLKALHSLAAAEDQVGDENRAIEMFEELLAVYIEKVGESAGETLAIKADLCSTLTSVGRFQDAESLIREVLRDGKKLDPSDIDLDGCRLKLASILVEQARYEEAERELQMILDSVGDFEGELDQELQIQSKDPRDVFSYVQAISMLGQILEFRNALAEAEVVYRKNARICEAFLGRDHVQTLSQQTNVAICLMRMDRLEEAEPLLTQNVLDFERCVGADNDLTIRAENCLASCLLLQGKMEDVEEMLLSIRERLTSRFELTHPDTITNTNNLANFYYKTKQLDQAEHYLMLALDGNEQVYGPDHPQTIITLASLGETRGKMGRFEQAEADFLKCLKLASDVFPASHPETLKTMLDLAFLYVRNERYQQAEPLLRELVHKHSEQNTDTASQAVLAQNFLAIVLTKQDKFEEAVPLYEQILQTETASLGPIASSTQGTFFALLRAESAINDFDSVRSRIVAYQKAIPEGQDPWLQLKLQSQLGATEFQLNNLDKAEKLLLDAFDKQSTFEEIDSDSRKSALLNTARHLIDLYQGKGDQQSLEEWKEKRGQLSAQPL